MTHSGDTYEFAVECDGEAGFAGKWKIYNPNTGDELARCDFQDHAEMIASYINYLRDEVAHFKGILHSDAITGHSIMEVT